MSDRTRITVRASRAQIATIDAQAQRLGITRSAYVLWSAVNRATADAEFDEVRRALEDFRGELAEALDAALDAHADRVNGNLKSVAEWMQKRWPVTTAK
jgi:hypothetical protein